MSVDQPIFDMQQNTLRDHSWKDLVNITHQGVTATTAPDFATLV